MLKRVDVAVYEALKNKQTGLTVLGLRESGVDYALDQYNDKLVTPAMRAKVEEARKAIIDGKLKVADYTGGSCK
jgi:basic membrane protein A